MRPRRHRLLVALASGAASLAVLAAGTPVAASVTPEPTPSASPTSPAPDEAPDEAPEVPKDPLVVVIERMTPSSLPAKGRIRVSGTIRNRSEETWTDLSAYLFSSYEPMTTADQLTAAVASDPRTDVGPRIVEPGLFTDVVDLDPGERTSFDLSVPVDQLVISGEPGVYWFGVHVLGTNTLGRLEGADGRARTFLPLVPGESPRSGLALGVQFRNHTVRAPDGRLEYLEGWQATFSKGGRLRRLLDLATTATASRQVSWIADPALIDAAESVVAGNPPLAIAPAEAPEEESEEEPELTAAQEAASEWIEGFVDEAGNHSVLALPYGDLDVTSAVRHAQPDLLLAAFSSSTALLEDREVVASPVLLPPSGLLSPDAVEALEPGLPLVLSGDAVTDPGNGPLLSRADEGRILLAPVADQLWGPSPGKPRAALAVRQRILADAALHALSEDRDQPLVRFLPPGWDPGDQWRQARFFEGLDVPWLSAVDVGNVLSGLGTPVTGGAEEPVVPSEDIVYPAEEAADELPLRTVLSTGTMIVEGKAVEELITDESDVDEQVVRQALLTSSFWSRFRPGLAAERAIAARERVASWLDEVTVRGPAIVTMSSETGTFQVTVLNGLDQRVTVGLRATVPGSDLRLTTSEPIELPPNGRGAMRIEATSTEIGVHLVTLQPVTTEGTAVGEPTRVSIRSSRVGLILWIVMGVGATALLVAISLRIWRRVRRRRRTHGPVLQRAET